MGCCQSGEETTDSNVSSSILAQNQSTSEIALARGKETGGEIEVVPKPKRVGLDKLQIVEGFSVPYKFESSTLITIASIGGANLSSDEKGSLIVSDGIGRNVKWNATVLGEGLVSFKAESTGRHLRVSADGELDVKGEVPDRESLFRFHDTADGNGFKLESAVYCGKFLVCGGDGKPVCGDGSEKAAVFKVLAIRYGIVVPTHVVQDSLVVDDCDASQPLRRAVKWKDGRKSLSKFDDWLAHASLSSMRRDVNFEVGEDNPAKRGTVLREFLGQRMRQNTRMIGYQVNSDLPPIDDILPLFAMHLNNAGDPFSKSHYRNEAKQIEVNVLIWFAELWGFVPKAAATPGICLLPPETRMEESATSSAVDDDMSSSSAMCLPVPAPSPVPRLSFLMDGAKLDTENPDAFWGYVLNMGSTEGNLNAIWNAREYLNLWIESALGTAMPGVSPVTCPVAIFSQDSHYSVLKSCEVLSLKTFGQIGNKYFASANPLCPGKEWPNTAPSNKDGTICSESLLKIVRFFAERKYPLVVVLNLGTTFMGACDAHSKLIPEMKAIVAECRMDAVAPKHSADDCLVQPLWVHLDAALGGPILPFLSIAVAEYGTSEPRLAEDLSTKPPTIDFSGENSAQSITCSFHKWFGAPFPTGVFMTRRKYLRTAETPDYIGSPDTTLGGSRSALNPLYIWWRLSLTTPMLEAQSVARCLANAQFLEKELRKVEAETGYELLPFRSNWSLSVTINAIPKEVADAYQIPSEWQKDRGYAKKRSHIYCMKHVTRERLNEFLKDLRQALVKVKRRRTRE